MSQQQATKSAIVDFSSGPLVGVGFANESSPSYYISFSFPERLDEGDVSEFELQLLQFFSSAFTENLRIKPKSTKLLLIEPTFLSKCIRDCIFRVLVRDLQVLPIAPPFFSLLILPTKVLSFSMIPTLPLIAIASAKSSGLIVSIEETVSEVILFSHNRLLMNSLKLSCGYNSCLKEIRRIISWKYSMELDTDTLYNILFTLLASYAQNREKVVLIEFKLQTLEFSEEEILLCVDALLFGSSIHDVYDDVGLVEAIFACINQGNVDDLPLQEKNIIFSGKGSSLPGLIGVILDALNDRNSGAQPTASPVYRGPLSATIFPFVNEKLSWIGAALLFSCTSMSNRFIVSSELDGKSDLSAPDWMSINPNDWKFFSSSSSLINTRASEYPKKSY